MRLGPINLSWGRKANGDVLTIDTLIKRIDAIYETYSGVSVTPENCHEAPTVKAILTACERRFAVMPVHVYKKTTSKGRTAKEIQPNHPVERLLQTPNGWQDQASYWQDAVSRLLRYGNFYANKARGLTGPIRRLEPLDPGAVDPEQQDDLSVVYKVTRRNGGQQEYPDTQIHHVRLSSRDGVKGNSPVLDVRETIALEIAAEKFGASFFGNGGLPGFVFEYVEGSKGFKTDEERKSFLDEFQERYTKRGRFRAILPPAGVRMGTPIAVENEKAQFLETRQYQRTVIAGAFGCPPHLVGDLSKGTFNNVEQQDDNFTINLILPLTRIFESAMEADLLTNEDRLGGIIIRFNPDAILRGDFKTRQEGLQIQRNAGVINADEWREREGMNPRTDEGGEAYYVQGPSGQQPSKSQTSNSGSSDQSSEDENAAAN